MSYTQDIKVIDLFLEDKQRHDRVIADLAANEKLYDDILDALRAAKIVTISTLYGLSVAVIGDANALQAIFVGLRRLGLKPRVQPEAGETTYESGWCDANGDSKLWLSFTSTQCVKVQVGTKTVTVEQPIYEVVCA